MSPETPCILCNSTVSRSQVGQTSALYMAECEVCGKYISDDFNDNGFGQKSDLDRAMISAYTRELHELQSPIPELHNLDFENQIEVIIQRYKNKSIIEKLNNLVLYVGHNSDYFGKPLIFHEEKDYPITYSGNKTECDNIKNQVFEAGYVKNPRSGGNVSLTWEGWLKYEELQSRVISFKKCFVAMSCKPELNEIYENGIKKAVEEAGYEPVFIEKEEHNEKICDLIIAEIRNSKFLVADVTGQRQNVYYEAGFAQGLNLDVIWTCHKDEINEAHFDTRQYNHIDWENVEDLKKRLFQRIKATII
ncbi:MAG: hypothetical protein JRI87_10135 [Deltaproteobacteria bacterium]|nr:hypothetical protein [Deltaproteobacteria bacterium]